MSFLAPIVRPSPFVFSAAMLVMGTTATLVAEDRVDDLRYPRAIAQVLFGTSGFEPGIAAEWRFSGENAWLVRPELFINEDGRAGAAGSLQWSVGWFDLPANQELTVGPRIAYHNSDDSGWEGDVMGIYHINIAPDHAHRHYIDIIGAVGVLEDKSNTNKHTSEFGGTIGVAYGFQF